MGQVPMTSNSSVIKVLIVGNGRVANAFYDILKARLSVEQSPLQVPIPAVSQVTRWHRKSQLPFNEHCHREKPTHVWIAVSDDAISEFAEEHFQSLVGRTVCHFSGGKSSFTLSRGNLSLTVHATHPLTTFGRTDTDGWKSSFDEVPFVLDRESVMSIGVAKLPLKNSEFKIHNLLPGLRNPVHVINSSDRPYYHALCALAGGMTVMIWESVAERFHANLGVNPSILSAFKKQIFENLAATDCRRALLGDPIPFSPDQ